MVTSIQYSRVEWRDEWKPLAAIVVMFLAFFFLPEGQSRVDGAVVEAVRLAGWYAREHVLLCLVPAFYIAGAVSVFLRQKSVMRYLGPRASKPLAYGVASVSGSILAVCSCTVLPLFGGIYRMGAGLGPAAAFLYSGPAINVLAIALTAKVLGFEIGLARAVGAVAFAALVGLAMQFIFQGEEAARGTWGFDGEDDEPSRSLGKTSLFFGAMVAVLVFANWGRPDSETGIWWAIWTAKWWLTGASGAVLAVILVRWLDLGAGKIASLSAVTAALAFAFPASPGMAFAAAAVGLSIVLAREEGEAGDWFAASWGFAKQIVPLLFAGVLVAGFLLGRPGHEGLIPSDWIESALGGNSLGATAFASVAGALMYFATLTEVPILEGLMGAGMGKGPALALLLAGPALSLPAMLVLAGLVGWKKTLTYVGLVAVSATTAGMIFGALV